MKNAWGKWLIVTKKIMHVQATIFLTIFFVIIFLPVGVFVKYFFPSALHNYSGKKQNKTFWLRRLNVKQDLHFAREQ